MGNAVEYKPPHGAFALAAKRMNRHRQSVERAYKNGVAAVMVEVAKAAFDIEKKEAEDRRKYRSIIKQAAEIANDVNNAANNKNN